LLPVDPTPAFGREPGYLAGNPLSSCAFGKEPGYLAGIPTSPAHSRQ